MSQPSRIPVPSEKSARPPWSVSVVIPLGPNEVAQPSLLSDLTFLPAGTEVILVTTPGRDWSHLVAQIALYPHLPIRIVSTDPGRASQLNHGAKVANGAWIWFLHADSRLGIAQIIALRHRMSINPDSLLYFNLSFLSDGPRLMAINVAGAWIRSHVFKLPFGDQGFCIKREAFFKIGGYDRGVGKGEDFFFVRAATKSGIKVNCTGSQIKTSARKYRQNGWLSTTGNHLFWTIRQFVPNINEIRNLRKGEERETRRSRSIR
jgi:hypothetical protein